MFISADFEEARQALLECVKAGLVKLEDVDEALNALEQARDLTSNGGGKCERCRFKTSPLSLLGLCQDCAESEAE